VREILPDGVYAATLLSVEDQQAADGAPYWRWVFTVNYEGRSVERTAASSQNFTPKSKPRRWAETLLGQKIADDGTHEFDLDQLIGRPCMVVLNIIERDTEAFNNVVGVLPPMSA
jgi:hypothetical protein